MPVDRESFKQALSRWASGVTIVTSRAGDRIHGMTVSAFASVSLEPPLVLVCADKGSITHSVIAESHRFAANVLAADQGALSNRFADKRDEHRRFEGIEWKPGATGCPLLPGAVAHVDCRVTSAHDAGDHIIYVGTVEQVATTDDEPLLYFRGHYHRLGADQGA